MTHKISFTSFVIACALCGCKAAATPVDAEQAVGAAQPAQSVASEQPVAASAESALANARREFATRIVTTGDLEPPLPAPPPGVFNLIRYKSPVGELAAYVTPDPGDGAKHPAIVWLTGGDSNSLSEMWTEKPRANDQSAAAYRKGGVVTMFPSLRGGNDNPGRREGFYGEVDDVIAAAAHLARLPYVAPDRIYLGGHSTGGTLVMLVAEMSTRFRAVFAFGPTEDVRAYDGQFVYHDPSNPREDELRAPGLWLDSVRSPLFTIEGTGGNIDSLRAMKANNRNPMIQFIEVPRRTHFNVLAPANELIASKILADTGPTTRITITDAEVDALGRR